DVDEHRHPGRRHVDEDDAVRLALRRVGGRDKERHVKARDGEQAGEERKPRNQLPGNWEKRLRSGEAKKIGSHQSRATRRAAQAAQGPTSEDTARKAPSRDRCAAGLIPVKAAVTAPAPNTSTGTNNGSTSRPRRAPPPRTPRVSAAPAAPSRLSTGVPMSRDASSTQSAFAGRSYCRPTSGAASA